MKKDMTKDELKEVRTIIRRTNKENPTTEDIQALRDALIKHPQLWRIGGDLAVLTQQKLLIDTPMSAANRELIIAALNALRDQLGYQSSSALEQMLIEQVLLSWLRLNLWEYQLAALDQQGMTQSKVGFWDKRVSAAQRRFLRACESIARIRKLTRGSPALQVNIATQSGQQVNIAGDFVKKEHNNKGSIEP